MRLDDVVGSQDQEACLRSIVVVAGAVSDSLGCEERARLHSMLVAFEATVAAKGWNTSLLGGTEWAALQAATKI